MGREARVRIEPAGISFNLPPTHGPGSGKAEWIALARKLMVVVEVQQDMLVEDWQEMAAMAAELEELRKVNRPGGRARLPEVTVKHIEEALKAGLSTRQIGARFRVSPMTASRVRKAMKARESQSTYL